MESYREPAGPVGGGWKLRVLVNQLRRKIEIDASRPKFIVTEPRDGYSFVVPGEEEISLPWSALTRKSLHYLRVRSYGMTDRGLVRESNEDHFLIADLGRTLRVRHSSLVTEETVSSESCAHVFVVADGMGGHQTGEVASELAVTSIERFFLNSLRQVINLKPTEGESVMKEFQSALVRADARVFKEAEQHVDLKGMGTTLTMAFVYESQLFVAHAGDSRCYLFSAGNLQQVTQDHTMGAEMVRRGTLALEEASSSKYRHVLTNALGGHRRGIRVELHKLDLRPGDTILLCSDGLTETVSDEYITTVLREKQEPQRICERLVSEANNQGGTDNITVLVARFESA